MHVQDFAGKSIQQKRLGIAFGEKSDIRRELRCTALRPGKGKAVPKKKHAGMWEACTVRRRRYDNADTNSFQIIVSPLILCDKIDICKMKYPLLSSGYCSIIGVIGAV